MFNHFLLVAFRNLWLADSDKDFLSWKIRIEKCEKTVKNLFSEVEAAVEENYNDISFLNHLIHLTLNHANDLLHILHDVIYKNYEEYDSRNIHFAKILVEQIMRHVINLRKHLKQLRKGNSMKALKSCPLDYLCEDMKLIWEKWELCKDEDVIYDSVMTNNMPLAQTFLIKVRDWPVENVSKEIKRITGLWIRELIKNNEIETTTTIFKNLVSNILLILFFEQILTFILVLIFIFQVTILVSNVYLIFRVIRQKKNLGKYA